MPDRPSRGVRTLALVVAATAAHILLVAPRLDAQQLQATRIAPALKQQLLTLTSDVTTAVVDVNDPRLVAQGVKTVISSLVPGMDVVVDSAGGHLRIGPLVARSSLTPLFVIDGVPLADGYGLTIVTQALERIDLFRDSASTAPYGLRGANGVVLIATARRN